jgi:hypothetical protein
MSGQETGDRSQGTEDRGQTTEDRLQTHSSPLPFRYVDEPAAFQDGTSLVVRVPAGVRSKQKLLGILVDRLRFPGYFGRNWDALEECLGDLSWLPDGQRVAIVHEGLPFGAGGEHRRTYLQILASAAARNEQLAIVVATRERDSVLAALRD